MFSDLVNNIHCIHTKYSSYHYTVFSETVKEISLKILSDVWWLYFESEWNILDYFKLIRPLLLTNTINIIIAPLPNTLQKLFYGWFLLFQLSFLILQWNRNADATFNMDIPLRNELFNVIMDKLIHVSVGYHDESAEVFKVFFL